MKQKREGHLSTPPKTTTIDARERASINKTLQRY
nr:MAG TPA: hypothetical protein [Caudoviricetes sp.]